MADQLNTICQECEMTENIKEILNRNNFAENFLKIFQLQIVEIKIWL